MKKIIRRYRNMTHEECKQNGLPTQLEMVQQGIWFGPETRNIYTTSYDIELDLPDDFKGPLTNEHIEKYKIKAIA